MSRGVAASRGTFRPAAGDPNAVTSGELVPPERYAAYAASTAASLTASQRLNLHYFTAEKTEPITQLETICGSTAAGATPTLCKVAIFEIAANGDGTRLALSANNTGLWAATHTAYAQALLSTFNKVAGQRYAVAALCVTAAALPILYSASLVAASIVDTQFARAPQLGGAIAAQADIPASFLAASVIANRVLFTVRLVP